jgi:urea carboxylase-associated protein 1
MKTLHAERLAPGAPWAGVVARGQILRIVDLEGRQAVDFLCYSARDPAERYHAPNTLKMARTLRLTRGHVLYSDVARPLMTIVEDTAGGHDTIGGCCSEPSNRLLYGVEGRPGCRENFLAALAPFGLGRGDIVPNVNFFCAVPVGPDNRLADTVFTPGPSRPGDHVDLRAEMDVLVALSNCPQVNNPCNDGRPTEVLLLIGEAGAG